MRSSTSQWRKPCSNKIPNISFSLSQSYSVSPATSRDQAFVCLCVYLFDQLFSHLPPVMVRASDSANWRTLCALQIFWNVLYCVIVQLSSTKFSTLTTVKSKVLPEPHEPIERRWSPFPAACMVYELGPTGHVTPSCIGYLSTSTSSLNWAALCTQFSMAGSYIEYLTSHLQSVAASRATTENTGQYYKLRMLLSNFFVNR